MGDGLPKSETAIKAWDAWAKALVQRYKDRITSWEIWNEPDIGKAVKADEYTQLYIRTAEMIRAETPKSEIYALTIFDHSVVLENGFQFSSTAAEPISVYGYRKQATGAALVTLWFSGAPVTETVERKPVDFTFKGAKFTNPVYVDLRTGGVYEIPASAWSQKGDDAKFSAIPVYDCPVLIAEKAAFLFQ